MKNTIVVLIVLLLNVPAFAQDAEVKTNNGLKSSVHLFSPKNSTQWDAKRFTELFKKLQQPKKEGIQRRTTFMDGYTVFPHEPIGNSSNSINLQYSPVNTKSSTALELLGIIAGPVLTAVYPSYVGSIYHNSGAAVQAYLESTHHQHDK